MTTQPTIHSFGLNSDTDGTMLTIAIAVPDALIGATLLAHITALTTQYQSVERQVSQSEAQPAPEPTIAEKALERTPAGAQPQVAAAPAAKTITRKTPAKSRKAAPPSTPEAVVATEAAVKQAKLTAVPNPAPVEPAIVEKVEQSTASIPVQTVVETPLVVAETPEPEPEPDGVGETCPPDIVTATSFRKVLEWMVAHGYTSVDMIVAKCEEYESQSPAISRAKTAPGAGLNDRVERGLRVIAQLGATA